MKTWNLGNTTVRNPDRIKDALRVFKEHFEGKKFDKTTQNQYFNALITNGIIKGDPNQVASRDWAARKWASAFNKLGLAMPRGERENPVVTVTAAGNALLQETSLESDIFLRQMLKVQLPSPTEAKLEGASLHPFYLVLGIAVALENHGLKPITKEELALFVQSATRDNQVGEIVEYIREYRQKRNSIEGRVNKSRFFREQLAIRIKELYGFFSPEKQGTLIDYSDTTVRYSAITGIFTIGQQSLAIKEDQMNLAKTIVAADGPPILEEEEFWTAFHDPRLPALPTDNIEFLKNDIKSLSERLYALSKETGTKLEDRTIVADPNILQLKRRRDDLEQELIIQKEIQFYRAQRQATQIEDILSLFESIKAHEIIGGSDYRPAWAEWGVWRVFLSINTILNPISRTRNFKLDTNLNPIHHAKSGVADMVFEYPSGFIMPTEVTLNITDRQYAAEREPVQTHVLRVCETRQDKEVIALFVAPLIDPRTAHEFFRDETYSTKRNKVINLDIIPLSFTQLMSFLPGKLNGCNNSDELHKKLKMLLELRKNCTNGKDWLTAIDKEL